MLIMNYLLIQYTSYLNGLNALVQDIKFPEHRLGFCLIQFEVIVKVKFQKILVDWFCIILLHDLADQR